MNCQVCSRSRVQGSDYCVYHEAANANLVKTFASWELAYGSIDWERYLESVSELSESGDWVRELASHELELISIKNSVYVIYTWESSEVSKVQLKRLLQE